MNKAFCKEPDAGAPPRCPGCGHDGTQVAEATLRAHVAADQADALGEPAYFCGVDTCPIAYFDLLSRSVSAAEARGLFWPKDPSGPLCACYGLSPDDIEADLADGTPTRVREVVRRAGLPEADCATRSADGRSCVARVQKFYLRRRAELGG